MAALLHSSVYTGVNDSLNCKGIRRTLFDEFSQYVYQIFLYLLTKPKHTKIFVKLLRILVYKFFQNHKHGVSFNFPPSLFLTLLSSIDTIGFLIISIKGCTSLLAMSNNKRRMCFATVSTALVDRVTRNVTTKSALPQHSGSYYRGSHRTVPHILVMCWCP